MSEIDLYKDKDWLEEQYYENKKTTVDIAEECQVSYKTIIYWMDKFDLKRRSAAEATKLASNNGERYKKRNWLKEEYLGKERDVTEIAQECSVSVPTIKYWINNLEVYRNVGQMTKGDKKRCSSCKEWRSFDMFSPNSRTSTGLASRCRICERKRNSKHKKQKAKSDSSYKINRSIAAQIRHSLDGNKRGRHWEDLVGYSLSKLKERLEETFKSEFTWENYGSLWQIDHIKPRASFTFDNPNDEAFKKCWALDNLQALSAKENNSKGAKLPVGERNE